jgi:hypothetical protein
VEFQCLLTGPLLVTIAHLWDFPPFFLVFFPCADVMEFPEDANLVRLKMLVAAEAVVVGFCLFLSLFLFKTVPFVAFDLVVF